ncbi:MAG: thioredoxin family protein [Candidatus Aenigmarchaeota archaeon]|nr:thioredoxin family protein [Candidatus Aenigmarchaeota archaeon]
MGGNIMEVIDKETKEELKQRFEKEMKRKIKLVFFVVDDMQKCPLCPATKQFVEELATITDKIEVEIHPLDSEKAKQWNITRAPTLLVDPDSGYKIIYTGAPLGYEAAGLVETIIQVSNDSSKLSSESKQKLKNLKDKKHIQIYVTPTCPYCPRQVLLANMIAIEAKGVVTSETVEAVENPDLAQKYQVQAVPFNVINGKTSSVGVQPEEEFVEAVVGA